MSLLYKYTNSRRGWGVGCFVCLNCQEMTEANSVFPEQTPAALLGVKHTNARGP